MLALEPKIFQMLINSESIRVLLRYYGLPLELLNWMQDSHWLTSKPRKDLLPSSSKINLD